MDDLHEILSQLMADPQAFGGVLSRMSVFRAFVEDVVDPEKRGRVRVRIPAFHGITTPTSHLPWAERCLPDGAFGSDLVTYKAGTVVAEANGLDSHTGDIVWVMLEGGDRSYPVVIGSFTPRGSSDPNSQRPVDGMKRGRYIRTRHGSTVEMSDEPGNFEVKMTMPSGHVIHMRESAGGSGIHIKTSKGHQISLQDEHAGAPPQVTTNAYDAAQDQQFTDDAGNKGRPVDFAPASGASPTVASGTQTPTPPGFGQQGLSLTTAGGLGAQFRDVTDKGITVYTSKGDYVELLENPRRVTMSAGDNYVRVEDGVGVRAHSQYGQNLIMGATQFGMFWGNSRIQFGGAGTNEWYIEGDLTIRSTGNMTVRAGLVLSEIGDSGRVESPPIGP